MILLSGYLLIFILFWVSGYFTFNIQKTSHKILFAALSLLVCLILGLVLSALSVTADVLFWSLTSAALGFLGGYSFSQTN